jgi:hypothetical protein
MNVTGPAGGEAGAASVSHTMELAPSDALAIRAVRAVLIGEVYDMVSPAIVLANPDMSDFPSDCCVDPPSCTKGMNSATISITLQHARCALMDSLV